MKKCLSLSRSKKKKSYATALGPERKPGEVYNGNILYPTGITNVARNCYLSAIMQCLCNHPKMSFVLHQLTASHPDHCSSKHCTCGQMCSQAALRTICQEYRYTVAGAAISPSPLLASLKDISPLFNRGEECDAHEFFIALFSSLISKINVKCADTIRGQLCVETIQTILFHTVRCKECGDTSEIRTKDLCLQLYAGERRSVHVQDLLLEWMEEEVTSQCDQCNKEVSKEKTMSFSSLPEVLCIHVGRPPYTPRGSPKVQVQKSTLGVPNQKAAYQLTGIVVYTRICSTTGHYSAFCRSLKDSKQWFAINDTQVIPVSVATVLQQDPYMLFYELKERRPIALSLDACRRLPGSLWLDDQVIDTYMALICQEAAKAGKGVLAMGSQLFHKFMQQGYEGVASWFWKTNIGNQDLIIFVINDGGNHWTMLVADMHEKCIEYYDSLVHDDPQHLYCKSATSLLDAHARHLQQEPNDWRQWRYMPRKDIPRETNGIDCGVFLCQYALYRVRGNPMMFTQYDMGVARKIMLEEVLNGQLLSHTERESLFSQRTKGSATLFYDEQVFLEPAIARHFHQEEILSLPKPSPTKAPCTNTQGSSRLCLPPGTLLNQCSNPFRHMQSPFIYPFTNISTHPQVPVSTPKQQLASSPKQPRNPLTHLPACRYTQPPDSPHTQLPTQPPIQQSRLLNQQPDSPPTQLPTQPPTHPPNPPIQPPTQLPTHPPSPLTQPPDSPPTQPPTHPPNLPTHLPTHLPSPLTQPTNSPPSQLPIHLPSPPTQPPDSSPSQLPTQPPTHPSSPSIQPPDSPPSQLPTQPPTHPPSPSTQLAIQPPAIPHIQPPVNTLTQPPANSLLSPSTYSITQQSTDLSNDSTSVSDLMPPFSDDDCTVPSPSPPPYSPIPNHGIVIDVDLDTEYTNEQLPPPIAAVLPHGYSYMFKQFQCIEKSTDLAFTATICINISSEEGATKWIQDFEGCTATTYRIRGNRKGHRVLYKSDRHCQHKRKKSNKFKSGKTHSLQRDKKTECPTHFTIKVHNTKTQICSTHPCEVAIIWDHNHSIHSAHALSFRPISNDTKEKFHSYFDLGHSPSSAIHHHSINLAIEYDGRDKEFEIAHADRSINPLPKDIYYLYNKWRVNKHGRENGEDMFNQLEHLVKIYNEEHGEAGGRAFVQRYEKQSVKTTWEGTSDQPLVLAVCTPLMARAHELVKQAGELVYCDATSSLDRYNCPTFVMSTCTSAGGIPLGVVITSGESEEVITEAMTFLKTVLPANAFYGKGTAGPDIFITDDSDAERAALRNIWPDSTLLLCIFHHLQSWWSWLWDAKHGIAKEDRQPIMLLVKRMLFTPNEHDFHQKYDAIIQQTPDSYTTQYPNLLRRLQQFWERRSEWALSYRVNKMMRGNHTNNYAEAGMRIIKEIVFGRIKAYNLIQMFQFVTVPMERYFVNRLLDMAHSRFRPGIALRYKELHSLQNTVTSTKKLRDSTYLVTEDVKNIGELEFLVDMDIGVCSCPRGCNGAACKHQAALAKVFNVCPVNLAPYYSKEARKMFADLAMGGTTMATEFYADLRSPSHTNSNTLSGVTEQSEHTTDGGVGKPITESSTHESTLDDSILMNDGPDPLEEQIENFRGSIKEIEEDIMMRVREADHNFISGVCKFIRTYRKMHNSSHAPTSTIAYALHNFGRPDRFTWSQGRRGRYIKTNAGGINRRRPGMPRGTKMAPQGRPIKRKIGAQDLSLPAKRPKKPHSLSKNIICRR